jgi:hypothetical protein
MTSHSLPVRQLIWATIFLFGYFFASGKCAAQWTPTIKSGSAKARAVSGGAVAAALLERIGPTSEEVLQQFREAGMAPQPHELTAAERRVVVNALAALPPLHQRVLATHLRSLSFLDNMPNTALTSTVSSSPQPLFDITIRAAILPQTATDWLTQKERTCFAATDSAWQVTIEAGVRSALDYVLLHEATHVVDAALHFTPALAAGGQLLDSAAAKPFTAGIWQSRTIPATGLRHAPLERIRFRGGPPVPVTQAEQLYTLLRQTPFVSLYGSTAWTEDLAEYVTVYHFTRKLRQPFRIVVRQNGQEVFGYEPMKSALVKRRVRQMKRFYA